jgi:hypothetical protein
MSELKDTTSAWKVWLKPSHSSAHSHGDRRRRTWAVVPTDSGGVSGIVYRAETEAERLSRKREKVGFTERTGKTYGNKQDSLRGSIVQRLWLVLTLLVMMVSPQLAVSGEPTPPYPIVDSNVWATNSYPGDIYWLDNERVLFLGSETSKPIGQDDQWLLIWDTRTNGITKYKQHVMNFCYRDGIIQYRTVTRLLDTGKRIWTFYRGKLNEESIDTTLDRKEDKLNCRHISVWPRFKRGKAHAILLEGHGYLVLDETAPNVRFENYSLLHHKGEDQIPIPLPFRRYDADRVNYYPFRQAYFLYPASYFINGTHLTPWPHDVPLYVWWLSPDGEIDKIEVPLGAWARGRLIFYPTLKGVFVVNRHSKSDRDPGNAGGYLVQGTTVKKLVGGVLTDVSAVSPDGCRIAFSHAPSQDTDRFDSKNHRRLKMIDICETGTKT